MHLRMKHILSRFFLFFFLGSIVFSCSTKKATVISRNYHALTSEYNILFNGNEALEKGKDELEKKVQKDFYTELPLEGMEFNDKITLPGQARSNYLDKAEEKAAKALQRHRMEIGGVEYNPKMDEAMLLLGKARYYDQRYLGALEAFNYALDNYYDTDLRYELELWRAKTRLRMGNIRWARNEFARIINSKHFRPDTKALAYAFISETYRGDTLTDTVGLYLSKAARQARSRQLKIHLAYKAAQVWEKLHRPDSALAMTGLILKKNYPEEFVLRTKWYRMRLTLRDSVVRCDTVLLAKYLKNLNGYLKNYYFHRYYPDIHYVKAEIYLTENNIPEATGEYGRAARSPNKSLKKLAYRRLADIYWNRSDYYTSGKYLDSLLSVTDKNTLEHLLISQKRRSIDKIVKWEGIIRRDDSILRFVRLDTATQRNKIRAYIAQLRAKEREQAAAKKQQMQTGGQHAGQFYFYNPEQVKKGKAAFTAYWGDRKLEDLWFLENKYGKISEETAEDNEENIAATNPGKPETEDKYTIAYYLNRLPRTRAQIDSVRKELLQAHLYLGINYADEKLKEYAIAKQHLSYVLAHQPSAEQEAQAYYMLYKIAGKQNQPAVREKYRRLLTEKFPDSPFTKFILHPDSAGDSDMAFLQDFQQAYRVFQSGKWTEAIRLSRQFYEKHHRHPDAPKFLLLEARARGKQYGIAAYKKVLNEITATYPGSDYAEYAKKIDKKLDLLIARYGKKSKDEFPYFLVFKQSNPDSLYLGRLHQCLLDIYHKENTSGKRIFEDRYTDSIVFTVTGNFLSRQSAEYILEKMRENHCNIPEHFIISEKNYINLQLTKGKELRISTRKTKKNVQRQEENRQRQRHLETTQPPGANFFHQRRNRVQGRFQDRRQNGG